jgi:GNAT superfamily N-acetyltransferase
VISDSDSVFLRRPRRDEVEALAELHAWSWRETYGPLLRPADAALLTVDERRRLWRRILLDPGPREAQWVADLDGVAVGMVHAGPNQDDDVTADVGEIHAIHVAPDRHGEGIGGLLIRGAEADLRGFGFPSATLWVIRENTEARRFYEAKGWRPDGATKRGPMGDFPDLPVVDEVRYVRTL